MTRDDASTTPAQQPPYAGEQSDPDEYVATGDEQWREVADDPEEVTSGDRSPGHVEPSGRMPSGESEQDLAAEDLGADPVVVEDELEEERQG